MIVKTVVAGLSAISLIAMAFLLITPAAWFLAFTGITLTWLFGEGVVKTAFTAYKDGLRGKPIDDKS